MVGRHYPRGVSSGTKFDHEVEDAATAVAPRVQPDGDHRRVHGEHLRLLRLDGDYKKI